MAGYVYKGTEPHKLSAKPAGRRPRPFDPDLCGTITGWNQHPRHGQPRCKACNEARRVYDAVYNASRRSGRE